MENITPLLWLGTVLLLLLRLRPLDEVSCAAIDLVVARAGNFVVVRAGKLLLETSLLVNLVLMVLFGSRGSMRLLL